MPLNMMPKHHVCGNKCQTLHEAACLAKVSGFNARGVAVVILDINEEQGCLLWNDNFLSQMGFRLIGCFCSLTEPRAPQLSLDVVSSKLIDCLAFCHSSGFQMRNSLTRQRHSARSGSCCHGVAEKFTDNRVLATPYGRSATLVCLTEVGTIAVWLIDPSNSPRTFSGQPQSRQRATDV